MYTREVFKLAGLATVMFIITGIAIALFTHLFVPTSRRQT
jgi:hypothetical protein